MVAFNGALVRDGTFYVHLYCEQTFLTSSATFYSVFMNSNSKVRAAAPIMQTIKFIWVDDVTALEMAV